MSPGGGPRGRSLLLAGAFIALSGCSSPAVKPTPQPRAPSEHKMVDPLQDAEEEDDGMRVEGTLGTLEEDAIQAALGPRQAAVSGCFQRQVQREPYLGGEVSIQIRVARDGTVKKLRLARSTVGSVGVERCITGALAGLRFSRPRGGEAELTYPLTFRGRLPAQVWDPGMVKEELLGRVDELLKAADGQLLVAPRGLEITFYVDGRGKPVSVGMTAEEQLEEAFAEAFITNLKGLKFVEPQGGYAKVSYPW